MHSFLVSHSVLHVQVSCIDLPEDKNEVEYYINQQLNSSLVHVVPCFVLISGRTPGVMQYCPY